MATSKTQIAPPGVRNPAHRTIVSKVLNDSMTYTKYAYETDGAYTEIDCRIGPGYTNPEHYHTLFAETFICKEGTLSLTLDGKKLSLSPGESVKVEIGHTHSLINDSDRDAKFITRLEPGNEGFEQAMYILHGLANDGMIGKDSIPHNPVTLSVVAGLMDTWLTGWMFWAATPLLVGLRRYGKGSGSEAGLLEKYWSFN